MNLIDALLGEHGLFHRLFQEIEDELSGSSAEEFDTRSALAALLASALEPGPDEHRKRTVHRMLALAREHFGKEERILFPLARDVIPVHVLVELGKRWALRSTVTLSPAVD